MEIQLRTAQDYFKSEQKDEANTKHNPSATLPFALIPGAELAITESNAILQYAADAYGKESFYPKDLHKRAQVNRWLLWESSQWFASCYVYVLRHFRNALLTYADIVPPQTVTQLPRRVRRQTAAQGQARSGCHRCRISKNASSLQDLG